MLPNVIYLKKTYLWVKFTHVLLHTLACVANTSLYDKMINDWFTLFVNFYIIKLRTFMNQVS